MEDTNGLHPEWSRIVTLMAEGHKGEALFLLRRLASDGRYSADTRLLIDRISPLESAG